MNLGLTSKGRELLQIKEEYDIITVPVLKEHLKKVIVDFKFNDKINDLILNGTKEELLQEMKTSNIEILDINAAREEFIEFINKTNDCIVLVNEKDLTIGYSCLLEKFNNVTNLIELFGENLVIETLIDIIIKNMKNLNISFVKNKNNLVLLDKNIKISKFLCDPTFDIVKFLDEFKNNMNLLYETIIQKSGLLTQEVDFYLYKEKYFNKLNNRGLLLFKAAIELDNLFLGCYAKDSMITEFSNALNTKSKLIKREKEMFKIISLEDKFKYLSNNVNFKINENDIFVNKNQKIADKYKLTLLSTKTNVIIEKRLVFDLSKINNFDLNLIKDKHNFFTTLILSKISFSCNKKYQNVFDLEYLLENVKVENDILYCTIRLNYTLEEINDEINIYNFYDRINKSLTKIYFKMGLN